MDEEGFEIVGRHPFDIWATTGDMDGAAFLNNAQSPSTININLTVQTATNDAQRLTHRERRALLAHWVSEMYDEEVNGLFQIVHRATGSVQELNNIHSETDRRVLQGADVIGITTSGLAARIALLKNVRCKVIICEEAGEILEPHMISALLPSVEHCIQIGDHEQLRPSVSKFDDLSLESHRGKLHQLDRSQFERLVVGEPGRPVMPVAQLNVQRRMRPEISTLIRETIYDKLIDHPSTKDMPDVVGIRNNVFWLDHRNLESAPSGSTQDSKSKTNDWEVVFVQALVRHVVRQGVYGSADIAVLTPYTGQLQKLRAAMRSDFEIVLSDRDREALINDGFEVDDEANDKVDDAQQNSTGPDTHTKKPLEKKLLSDLLRLATVDNFQGEEAKVIIVSLVRSNNERRVGFLKTSNRINVLLSRAKHGMYIVGNTDTYSNIDMWQKVIHMLRAKHAIDDSLHLCCPRHPEKVIEVRQPDDFAKFSPEGGCREACADRLDCGHRCQARCHSQAMHEVFHCEQPCQRRHKACDHLCQKSTCGEDCGKCTTKLDNVQLPCGHTKHKVMCYKTLDLASIRCEVIVSKEIPDCKHRIDVKCGQDISKATFKCPKPCQETLSCGHACFGTCGYCNTKDAEGKPVVDHRTCMKICGRKHGTCSHNCNRLCHDGTECGLCQQPCEVCLLSQSQDFPLTSYRYNASILLVH